MSSQAPAPRSLFFAVPLPLNNPSNQARLGALSILKVPESSSIEQATLKKHILCKIAPHTNLSLAYLFSQGIDPHNLQHGLNALSFLREVNDLFQATQEQDILIAFSLRHLSVLNGMALQNFMSNNFLERFNYVLDLKTALETCFYFGNTKVKNARNLNQSAQELGFKQRLDNQLNKAEALHFIYQHLLQHDSKIMAFLSMPANKRAELCLKSQFVVHIDEQSKLCVLKVLKLSDNQKLLKALKSDGKEVKVVTINFDLAPLIAPLSILTEQRQEELRFNLAGILDKLNQCNLSELIDKEGIANLLEELSTIQTADLPFYEQYLANLEPQEMELFTKLQHKLEQEKHSLTKPHDGISLQDFKELSACSAKMQQQALCFFNENYASLLSETPKQQYTNLVQSNMQKRSGILMQEYKMLEQNLNEKDAKGINLLQRIISFF